MPRVEEKRRDSVGIRFSGSVLTGEKSVEQRLRESDIRARMEVDKRERGRRSRSLSGICGMRPGGGCIRTSEVRGCRFQKGWFG